MKRLAAIIILATCVPGVARLQDFDQTSCDEFLVAPREARGQQVGATSCLMQETDLTFEGRTFRRLDIGLDGTVEGFLTATGDDKERLTNAPDLVFPQTGDPGPVLFAVARYERARGASMTVIYPLEPRVWNKKMWVTVHGGDVSFAQGQLPAWAEHLDRRNPLRDLNDYDKLILAKGSVLVKTRRTTTGGVGEISATLENGTTVDHVAFSDTARYVMDFTAVAERAIARRLGAPPSRTYFYGHSAGASIGRGLNYTPGLNLGADGAPVFDGVLADDAAGGAWLPVLFKGEKDVLLTTAPERERFVPQIDVTHQMYSAVWRGAKPDHLSISSLANARSNATILRDKGLASKTRTYEVRSISHHAGETPAEDALTRNLDLSRLMDRLIDYLDAWVERGTAPPPTRSDWAPLGDADGDGRIEHPGIAFPEVACPFGVYFPYPVTTSPRTSFAAFAPGDLEPLDAAGGFVDMNRNGIRDHRETLAQAWRRLGLLRRGEDLTREKYAACVQAAAGRLRHDGFFSDSTVQSYVEQAEIADLAPASKKP